MSVTSEERLAELEKRVAILERRTKTGFKCPVCKAANARELDGIGECTWSIT